METAKLILSPKRFTDESQVISVRLPKDMLKEIDAAAQQTGRTRNELIVTGLGFALEHLEIQ